MKRVENKEELQELNNQLKARLDEEKLAAENESNHKHGRSARKSGSRSKGKKSKKRRGLRVLLIILGVIVFLALAAVGTFFVLQWQGRQSLTSHEEIEDVEITAPETVVIEDDGDTITYNGKKYRRNEGIISILCMGIDKKTLGSEDTVAGENGQADTIFVVALDTETGGMKLINISRETMIEVDVYNINSEFVRSSELQICMAYAYGDGRETSCQNMMKSVSKLLYGMPIDAYAAIDLPAITVLNDAIGGVEVEVLEDLSSKDPELVQGARVLLKGNQAVTYVRSREHEVDSNNYRMARQRQYLTAFISKALAATKEDITVPLTLYQAATEYMVTDIDTSELTYLVSLILEKGFSGQDIINVPGESKLGEQFAEYHVDETALYEIILDVYYTEV